LNRALKAPATFRIDRMRLRYLFFLSFHFFLTLTGCASGDPSAVVRIGRFRSGIPYMTSFLAVALRQRELSFYSTQFFCSTPLFGNSPTLSSRTERFFTSRPAQMTPHLWFYLLDCENALYSGPTSLLPQPFFILPPQPRECGGPVGCPTTISQSSISLCKPAALQIV